MRRLSLLLAAVLCAQLPLAVSPALAASPAPYGDRDLTAFNLEDAYRLPGVYATDLTVSREGKTLTGTFTAMNLESDAVGPLQYNMEVRPDDGEVDGPVVYSRTAVRVPFTLQAREKKTMDFSLALPDLPAGNYVFRVQMTSAEGRYLGWADLPLRLDGNATAFLGLRDTSLELPEFAGKPLEAMTGPNVSAQAEFFLRATVCNPAASAETVVPVLETYEFDAARGEGAEKPYPAITVPGAECRDVRLPVEAPAQPRVYQGMLRFDSTDGAVRSARAEYRWVVRGADADIFPMRLESVGLTAGSRTTAKIDVVGPADAETELAGVTLRIELLDARGALSTVTTPAMTLTDAISSGRAGLVLSRDASGAQRIRVTVLDKDGAPMAVREAAVPGEARSALAGTVLSAALIAVMALLALGAVGSVILALVRGTHRAAHLRAGLAFTLILAGSHAGTVGAVGTGNGIEVFTPRGNTAADPFWHHFATPSLITLFINAPIHNAPAGTYNRANIPLQYRVTYGVCQNRIAYARIIGRFDLNGGKQTTLEGTGANWRVVHDHMFSQGCPGGVTCMVQNSMNTAVNLSALPAATCTTTLQLVGKLGQSGLSVAAGTFGPPNANVSRQDPSFAYRLAHAVNLWLNFPCRTDLVIQKTGPATIAQGQNITYTITVRNASTYPASAVNIADFQPQGLVFLSSQGAACAQAADAVRCNGLVLQPGETKAVQLTFVQTSLLACGTVLSNRASVGSPRIADPDMASNYSEFVTTTVQCGASSASAASSTPTTPQCRDGIDNDNDGATDANDFSCSGPDDTDETNPKAQCQDGFDNDGDGLTDYPQDPGCSSRQDNDEFNAASSASSTQTTPQCRDNMDNDGDGATDYPSDFSCSSAEDTDETLPRASCQDTLDNDGDGLIDLNDPGCQNRQDNDEWNAASSASSALPQCRDGQDNDNDGATDLNDFSCSHGDDTDETNPKAQCQDGFDNDGDGLTDYPQDPGCSSRQDNDEFNAASSAAATPQCRDNMDNDGDGATDYPSDFSCSGSDDGDEAIPRAACQDTLDNDGDGLTDFPNDPGCQGRQDNDESNQASSSSAAASLGCVLVLNETFDTQGNPITQATAQFTYTLGGSQTAVNNAAGIARFDGLPPGNHLVTQQAQSAWTNLSVTPAGGMVQVTGGPVCAAVIFKNKQNSVSGQSSSVYNPYPPQYYQPDPYANGNGAEERLCRGLADKYGDRYASSKKRKKLPKAIRNLMDDCDDEYGNESWWDN